VVVDCSCHLNHLFLLSCLNHIEYPALIALFYGLILSVPNIKHMLALANLTITVKCDYVEFSTYKLSSVIKITEFSGNHAPLRIN